MFESDDFDEVLSQFDFPVVVENAKQTLEKISKEQDSQDFISCTNESKLVGENINKTTKVTKDSTSNILSNDLVRKSDKIHSPGNGSNIKQSEKNYIHSKNTNLTKKPLQNENCLPQPDNFVSPKHLKRKIISSHFDQQSKRKFPGPAGLLTGVLEETKDESIGQIEFLSQDMDFTENNLRRDLFESPLWKRLLSDMKEWKVHNVDSIKTIKQQALSGNLRRRKAQSVTTFIEAVDRSVTDPLIILRDETGSIKCTLHRDAWSTFSPYLVSEYCALVLQKPTVLTTGGAFKKHYLNITLSNILAVFSSAVLKEERILPEDYKIEYEEDFTVIKSCLENKDTSLDVTTEEMFDGLDNFFSDDLF